MTDLITEVSDKEKEYYQKLISDIKSLSTSKREQYFDFDVENQLIYVHPDLKNSFTKHSDELLDKLSFIFSSLNESNINFKRLSKDNIFRAWIDDYLMIIFSKSKDNIYVHHLCNHFIEKNDQVQNSLQEIQDNLPSVMSTTETLNFIIKNNCSVSRFGDGEFNLINGKSIGFQPFSESIRRKLIAILKQDISSDLLITIPEFNNPHNNIMNCFGELSFWENYWLFNYSLLKKFFSMSYGNTDISRNTVFIENDINTIKKIWENRKVVFVYGNGLRFEANHDLFDEISERYSIIAPAINAFSNYEEIFEECLNYDNDHLFLLSLGPTATILASDLSKIGYQAIDIGHITSSFSQYKGEIESPELLPIDLK